MLKRGLKKKKDDTSVGNPFWPDTKNVIDSGAVTPFISNFISYQMLGANETAVAQAWAEDVGSPLGEGVNQHLPSVAQYHAVKTSNRQTKIDYLNALTSFLIGMAEDDDDVDEDYLDELREEYDNFTFSEIAYKLGYPKYESATKNPMRLLAEMPLPIYVTTSYHDFLEVELSKVPKQPVTEIFYWHDSLYRIPSIFDDEPDYRPTVERPLVYHLHGLDKYPESMVLTENDYMDLLIRLSLMQSEVQLAEQTHVLPSSIRQAVAGTSILMLGYGIYDWEFRVLFKGLVQSLSVSRTQRKTPESISMQIADADQSTNDIKKYLEDYFKQASFRVYWGTAQDCVQALWKLWRE